MKRRKLIIFVGILSHIGWFSYFVLQGDFISGVSNVIGIISNLIFMFREKYRWANSKLWLFFFLAIAGVYSSLTFKVWKDIFPMIV
jgi:hypothetical protein